MTEAEWLSSDDPAAMLGWHGRTPCEGESSDGKRYEIRGISDRKVRLFACACVRQVWHLLADARSRRAVEVTERYADQLATREELNAAQAAAWAATRAAPRDAVQAAAQAAAWDAAWDDPRDAVQAALRAAAWAAPRDAARDAAWDAAVRRQAGFLRDIVGNPWRPVRLSTADLVREECRECDGAGWYNELGPNTFPVTCWRCDGVGVNVTPHSGPCPWLTPTVKSLAQAAYEERQPDGTLDPVRLAVLADALEEAGCDSEDLLLHLRGWVRTAPGANVHTPCPHVRGCWAVDLLLGKE